MRVLLVPYNAANPYQRLLADAVESGDFEIDRASADAFLFSTKSLQCDVLHLHWLHELYMSKRAVKRLLNTLVFFVHIMILRARGARIVWTVHNLHDHESSYPLLDAFCTRLVVRSANAIIVHCNWAKSELKDAYPRFPARNIHVVPHGNYVGVYTQDIGRRTARSRLGLSENGPVFLFFGGIRPYKGVPELLSAFKDLPADSNAVLIIAGKPFSSDLLDEIVSQTSDANIHLYLRHIGDDEIQLFFEAADYQVLPYRAIATSGAAILGMSFGCAMIAPRLGCLPEVLDKDGAILYDPQKAGALREALTKGLESGTAARRMGESNLSIVSQWPWEAIARKTSAVYLNG